MEKQLINELKDLRELVVVSVDALQHARAEIKLLKERVDALEKQQPPSAAEQKKQRDN